MKNLKTYDTPAEIPKMQSMRWLLKRMLPVVMRSVLRVAVYGLLLFFGVSAVLMTFAAILVGWDTPPYPGEYVELAIFYDILFAAMMCMVLNARRRVNQNGENNGEPSPTRRPGLAWLRHLSLILPFSLAILFTLISCGARLVHPEIVRTMNGLAGVCWALVAFELMLTALYGATRPRTHQISRKAE